MVSAGSILNSVLRNMSGRKLGTIASRAVLSAVAILAPATAVADPEDTLNFALGAGVRYDDNLFRLDDSVDTRPLLGRSQKSDWIYSTNAGIKIDKPYSQQRFQLDAMVIDNKYRTYDFLDYTAFNYRAAWLWHLTPDVSGILLADQNQTLNNFADFRSVNSKSIQTNQTKLFTIDGQIGGGVHLIGGLSEIRSRNSQAFTAVGDYLQEGIELGVKYIAPSESWVSLVQRESRGEYRGRILDPITQLDTGFDQSETEANVSWRVTGKSIIDAKLGYLDRQHNNFSQRDYSGTVGRVAYRWLPTDKLQLSLSLSRNLFSFQESTNSYYVADTLSIAPIWKVSAKTTVRLRYDYSDRDYHGAIVATPEMRQDKAQLLLFATDWQATRTILVSGALQRETRSSNFNNLDYDSNSANISAQLLF